MNNDQFRKLVSDTPRVDRSQNGAPSATPALGSRQRASIPMTPRSLGGSSSNDFARQLAAHRATLNPKKERKFRSAAPLGSKLPEGYVDRAKQVREAENAAPGASSPSQTNPNDREKRLIALMDMVREGKIDKDTAIEQTKLLGGDVSSTHLVKGLDFALLERARKGEDLLAQVSIDRKEEGEGGEREGEGEAVMVDIDDELDKELEKEAVAVVKERKEKKQQQEVVPKKRTRAEILAELKKSRAPSTPVVPVLGSKFKKIQEKVPKSKKKSGEAQVDQHVGKKVKVVIGTAETIDPKKPLMGMLPPPLPASAQKKKEEDEEEEEEDIFADAGADYDPLAGILDSDDDDDSATEDDPLRKQATSPKTVDSSTTTPTQIKDATTSTPPIPDTNSVLMPPPPPPPPSSTTTSSSKPSQRNYFGNPTSTSSSSTTTTTPQDLLTSNPELLAAIKRASSMAAAQHAIDNEKPKPSAKHQAMLDSSFRDDIDVDMGFGASRTFGDDDDDEGPVEDEEGGGGGGGKGGDKKKRKRKKNKA